MFFGICPRTSRTPKFWHTYVITYGDFIAIAEPCYPFFHEAKNRRKTKIKKNSTFFPILKPI